MVLKNMQPNYVYEATHWTTLWVEKLHHFIF